MPTGYEESIALACQIGSTQFDQLLAALQLVQPKAPDLTVNTWEW
jgi:hypothetical protein